MIWLQEHGMRHWCSKVLLIIGILGHLNSIAKAEPYSYREDCESHDPFRLWTSDGTFDIKFKGLVGERVASGRLSCKLDISLGTATYVYFRIPLSIPSTGILKFSGRLDVAELSSARVSLGTNASLSPSPLSGTNPIQIVTGNTNGWTTIEGDLVDAAQHAAERSVPAYLGDARISDVGKWTDAVVLYIWGTKGGHAVVYVDDIQIVGDVPSANEYDYVTRSNWTAYVNRVGRSISDAAELIEETRVQPYKVWESAKHDSSFVLAQSRARGYPTPQELQLLHASLDATEWLRDDSSSS